jgi:rhodanese-related sulfurtransferase
MRARLIVGIALGWLAGAGGLEAQEAVALNVIRVAEVNRLLEKKAPVVLVDVRTPEEYRARRIKGAISVPLADLEARYREIPRTGLVVLY